MNELKESAANNNRIYSISDELKIFKIAATHLNIHIFLYTIATEKIHFFESRTPPFGVFHDNEYSLIDIISNNIFDADNRLALKQLFKAIHNGENEATATVKATNDSNINWNNITLSNFFDANGNPTHAIGTVQDVTNRVEVEMRYLTESQYRLAMMADSRRVYEINVTRDRFVKLESKSDTTDCDNWSLYTKSMSNLCKTNVFHEDWETFLKIATRENLLDGFKNGITEFYCEYRTVDEHGNTSWSSSTTHLLHDPVSNDIKGFIYVKDIDKQKRRELELYQLAEHDPLTGIYNRRTAERLITQIFLSADDKRIYGFMTIDIDEFKYVNDTFGHVNGDLLLQRIVNVIGGGLRNDDIFARIGGDEFIVFINGCNTVDSVADIAKRLCQSIREISIEADSSYHPTASIGIAIYPTDGNTFAELYQHSDLSMYKVKQSGKNNSFLYNEMAIEKTVLK